MDVELFRNAGVDLLEEVQNLGDPVALVAFSDREAGRDIERGEQRGGSHDGRKYVSRSGMPGIIGRTGCSRSSAWI